MGHALDVFRCVSPLGREPLVYQDTGKREQLASMRNGKGETPLHTLAQASLVNFGEAGKRPPGATGLGLGTLSGRTSVVSMQVSAARTFTPPVMLPRTSTF